MMKKLLMQILKKNQTKNNPKKIIESQITSKEFDKIKKVELKEKNKCDI